MSKGKKVKRKEQQSKLYQSFCDAEGSLHIASEYAILKLQELIRKFKVTKVLEDGLGIGSISGIVLALNKNLIYSGTEANNFCLNSLSQNLKEDYSRLKVYSDLSEIPSDKKFDLIIIDGKDQNLQAVKDLISENGIIAIEGDRMPQQEILRRVFSKHQYVHSVSLSRNKSYSPFPAGEWQGGLKVLFVNPTIKQSFWWLMEKYLTKIKYQYPGRYLGGVKM